MSKEPFIIDVDRRQVPNISGLKEDDYSFEFSQTDSWRQNGDEVINALRSIDEKLDFIIRLMQKKD